MSYRKEKKFRLNRSESKLLKFSLLEKGMEILYPKRNIKSCYFDTKNLLMFNQSEDGILPRKKIRYRWYDSNSIINKGLHRFKVSSAPFNTFFSHPCTSILISAIFNRIKG